MEGLVRLCASGLIAHCPPSYFQVTLWIDNDPVYIFPGEEYHAGHVTGEMSLEVWPTDDPALFYAQDFAVGGPCDVDLDGEGGTEADIIAFFAAYWDGFPVSDWNNNGIVGTIDNDLELFLQKIRSG